jgi:hypothetical protein
VADGVEHQRRLKSDRGNNFPTRQALHYQQALNRELKTDDHI